MKDRILDYLAAGVKPAQVCSIVGCTPAYISQLLANEDFKLELNERISNQPEDAKDTALDTKYDATEHRILEAVNGALANAELPALVAALRVVGERQEKMKQRKNPVLLPASQVNMVSITMPMQYFRPPPTIHMNEQQEVIAVGDSVLAPMSADGVRAMFTRLKEPQNDPTNTLEALGSVQQRQAASA